MITDEDIIDIAEQAADKWLNLAHRLPHAGQEGLAFPLNGQVLREIETDFERDYDKLVKVLQEWRLIHPRHRWGLLWDTLFKCGLGAVADNVLKRSGE